MHKIIPKYSDRGIKISKPVSKPTVFEQLDKLKRLLRASGIKVNVNELLKGLYLSRFNLYFDWKIVKLFQTIHTIIGSKNFQERYERIRKTLQSNGIEGEPTMGKCKQLKKQLKLREEIAGLDPSVIIESNDDNDGRLRRSTRITTRRNYVYNEIYETKSFDQPTNDKDSGATSQSLQNMREFIDSDSDYRNDEQNGNNNNNNNNNSSSDSVDLTSVTETMAILNGQNGVSESSTIHKDDNNEQPSTENPTQVTTDNQLAQCKLSLDQVIVQSSTSE